MLIVRGEQDRKKGQVQTNSITGYKYLVYEKDRVGGRGGGGHCTNIMKQKFHHKSC